MRILWICGARAVGGAEQVTLHLAQLLRDRGHDVHATCPAASAVVQKLAVAHLPVHPARLGGSLNVRAVPAIRRALRSVAPDIALVTTSDEWVWACLARRGAEPARFVLVRHMVLPLSRRVCWLAGRRADAVVAVSQAVRQRLLTHRGIPPERIHVIYNPVRFAPRLRVPTAAARAGARRALGLADGGRWVGFFGGLNPAKGLRDVAEAVRRANAACGPTHLIVGGAQAVPAGAIRSLAHEFDLDGRLHELGDVADMEQALLAAEVAVVATHRQLSEALPATLLEAMACGTPVVGYATGGIPEIIGEDGLAGRLARPDDTADLSRVLVEVLGQSDSAQRMATAALQRVRQLFDSQQAVERYDRLFTSLAAR